MKSENRSDFRKNRSEFRENRSEFRSKTVLTSAEAVLTSTAKIEVIAGPQRLHPVFGALLEIAL